jgi:hypothetical protein
VKKLILPILLLLLALGACREVPSDRLYALHLEQPPSAADWQRALPRLVTVRGGSVHRVDKLADIDADSVHTTTASCHHGASLPDPVPVDMRAFYTDSDLYLRLSWPDRTRDDAMRRWRFDGEDWSSDATAEDGFGLLWDTQGRFPQFTCAYACHLHDFGVSGSSFHATNKMKLARAVGSLDLWNWKAARTGAHGFADDRYLDGEGMRGDAPGELLRPNSRSAVAGGEAFAEGDRPVLDGEGRPVGEHYLPPGTTAPGFLTERPLGSRADVAAHGRWHDGRWTVVLRRPLNTGDSRDVVFVPGDESGVAFGLSLMDNTLFEHYASTALERLVLLAATAATEDRER